MGEFVLHSFVLMLVVLDPVGMTPLFSALTAQDTPEHRRNTAVRSIFIAGAVLALFIFAGTQVLAYLGIGIPAFRIAGGVLLFLIAVDMLFVHSSGLRGTTLREQREAAQRADISVFPLAIPLIAGPGALTTVLLLTQEGSALIVLGATAAVLVITLVMFLISSHVQKILGETGINVFTRLMGILLTALAIQYVVDGLRESFPVLLSG